VNVYLGKAETEFVQGKPKGYVRDLVRREMEAESEDIVIVLGTMDEVINDLLGVETDPRDVPVWKPPEVRPPGLRKR
jgi:hypothetical protein